MGRLTQVTFMKCLRLMFSLVTLPPQMPQPRLDVIGMPFVKDPALAFDWGWRTMIRLTGATLRQPIDVVVVERIDATGVARPGYLVDATDLVECFLESVIAIHGKDCGQLLAREAVLSSNLLLLHDDETPVIRDGEPCLYRQFGGRLGDGLDGARAIGGPHGAFSSRSFSSGVTRYPPSSSNWPTNRS